MGEITLFSRLARLYTAGTGTQRPIERYREGNLLMYRRLWILAVLVLLGLSSGGVAAQEASPAPDDFVTPDPADCTVEPRTVDELRAYLEMPAPSTPVAATAVPEGEPADDETAAAATSIINEFYACINANAFLRSYGLYSDAFLESSIAGQDLNPDALELFATPIAPQAEGKRVSIAVGDIEVLEDGRVSVAVVSRTPLGDNVESTTTFILVEQEGRWLIDYLN